MVDKIGFKDPIGQKITNGWEHFTIIGVVEDFNFESMKQKVDPICLALGRSNDIVSVKIKATDVKQVLADINGIWKGFAPNQPIRYTFLDESFANMYADLERTGLIFTSFSVLAIIVACLGLFALASFMAEQRNKEISIRKVLGASPRVVHAARQQLFKTHYHFVADRYPSGLVADEKMAAGLYLSYNYNLGCVPDRRANDPVHSSGHYLLPGNPAAVASPIKSLRSE